ncbi:Cof-type HAD-IIB family hydrolase [Vibrio sp. TH_r3]|uniref:Cof-type HAD-IIB family hydrolase n=1 Tax=Vibrio sp. TH_r3 TaxID=3082084 RepID=UPI002953B81D|nr:Cof-type HAD-IIB family hydrolase [Vibrio sp. TH_r3]MDV7105756.1 Cof-type HAD-IIB family hydrolase [Vibrio sp. TH_r3]
MYKVLALDLDGTILTDDHTVHPQVKKAIQEIKQYCRVIIVTGRHHTAARPYYYELGLDTPIICCNGTYMYDYKSETVLKQNAIEKHNALRFIEKSQEFKLKMVMYITDAMTYSNYNPFTYMLALERWADSASEEYKPNIYRVDSFTQTAEQAEHVWKFVVEGSSASVKSLMQDSWVKENFNGERSWSNRVDFAARGNSKGPRLAEYVKSLGYKASDVIAIGDNHNDISMLSYAGFGVAMLNADSIVKSHVQTVCATDNNHDGIAHLIREKIKG